MIRLLIDKHYKIVESSVEEILFRFREYALSIGIKCYRDIRNSGDELTVTCPNAHHKNRQENNPSCSVAKVNKYSKGRYIPAGYHYCYSCKYAAPIDVVFSQILGYNDNGEHGRKWIVDNFIVSEEFERDFKLDLDRTNKISVNKFISEEELSRYRYYSDYWKKRGISEETCVRFDLGFDIQQNSITMPIWDNYGRCVGVSRRRIDKKQYKLPQIEKPVYLLNYAIKEHWGEIYLCESQINALYLNELGYHACACFGTGTLKQANQIICSGVRSVVFCFDGDSAGRKGAHKMYEYLRDRVFCSYIDMPDGTDINDYKSEDVHKILKNNLKNF